MEKYVYEALMQMGHSDYALERFKKRFGTMIDDTLHTTLYEGWQEGGYGGGSTNHAWSGGMLTDICEQILGIRPTVAGWKEAVIEPRFSPIKEGTISIPTVNGTLKYSFKDDGEYYHATVNVPKGMKAVFIAPDGNKKELSAGVNAVEFREE